MRTFGELATAAMKEAGLNQTSLAQKMGKTQGTVGKYLSTTSSARKPGYDLVLEFAIALGVEPGTLFPTLAEAKEATTDE